MTTNDPVATVRAALAAAVWQGPGDNRDRTDGCRLIDANAPTWLPFDFVAQFPQTSAKYFLVAGGALQLHRQSHRLPTTGDRWVFQSSTVWDRKR